MTPSEAVQLLAVVSAAWPQARVGEGTVQAWHQVLGDLPSEAVRDALLALARTNTHPPSAAEIRRRVAADAGLLSPDEDEAWQLANAVARAEGVGRRELPEAVKMAYDAVGGAHALATQAGVTMRAQFRDFYRQARQRTDDQTLADDLHDTLLQLEPARQRPALT